MDRNKAGKLIAIIGGGLAGCVLALRFIEQGFNPIVFDDGETNSSRVAAGLWNPVVFKRLTTAWLAKILVEEVFNFYPRWQRMLGVSFFYPLPIYKFINNYEELSMWQRKANDAELYDFIHPKLYALDNDSYFSNLGYCVVKKGGFINTNVFLDACCNFFRGLGLLSNRFVSYEEFLIKSDELVFENFDVIVFAQGYRAQTNPFFNKVRFNLCKGDILEIEADGLIKDAVVNNNGFIVPLGKNRFKIGSTYVWDFEDSLPSERGFELINQKLKSLIKVPYKVLSHQSGVRPTTLDRKPILGSHPVYKNVYIFNGLGTKGVLLAPYFSRLLVDHIITKQRISSSVAYERFI